MYTHVLKNIPKMLFTRSIYKLKKEKKKKKKTRNKLLEQVHDLDHHLA